MISVKNIVKRFDGFTALDNISCVINEGCIYGMVGSNGAGKSTLMRILSGVYRPDEGSVEVDGRVLWNNPEVKCRLAYVSDELYYLPGADLNRMGNMYKSLYPQFNAGKLKKYAAEIGLPMDKSMGGYSKGMKRQAMTILALATEPDYIFFDETFDGLDPVMRNLIKRMIVDDINERGASAMITSHSLRELEDTCDQLTLLHKGGLILESDINRLKTSRFKVQIAFSRDYDVSKFGGLDIVSFKKSGSVANMIVSGDREEVVSKLAEMNPILLDVLPLTLEEVFTYEMQIRGYSFEDAETTAEAILKQTHNIYQETEITYPESSIKAGYQGGDRK